MNYHFSILIFIVTNMFSKFGTASRGKHKLGYGNLEAGLWIRSDIDRIRIQSLLETFLHSFFLFQNLG